MGQYSPPWTSAMALMFILLELGASISGTGLALEHSQEFIDVGADLSHRQAPLIPTAAAGAATNLTALDLAARYRPPIINFKSQGGPVLSKPINIYIIWYGAWAATEKSVIRTALSSLTPAERITDFPNLSNLWSVMTKYNQQVPGQALTNNVTVMKEVDDGLTASQRTINSSVDPLSIIVNQINLGNLPEDLAQGVYFVLTGSDIVDSNGVTGYCGYHFSACKFNTVAECNSTLNNLVYAFVPLSMPNNTFAGCNLFRRIGIPGTPPNSAVSPNGKVDSIINVIMHELLELAVDPYPSIMPAYIFNTSENSETADLCAYNFVAGDWFYCYLPSEYPDFNTSNLRTCLSWEQKLPAAGDPPRSLRDPVTNVSFNQYGIGGSQFLVQKMWSLVNKGCVLAPEDACPTTTVSSLDILSGNISRGYFFNGVGLQAYAPGQNCTWQCKYSIQKTITFTFKIYALGYDALDYIQVWQNGVLVKTLTGFGSNVVVTAMGTVFNLNFVTDGSRSPYPISAGFSMTYTAV